MIPEKLEKILLKVQKPSRYIGGELHTEVKFTADARMALSYPDLYEVAMSNNGLKILYDRANSVEGMACERVFAVAPDFETVLRDNKLPLYTLETFTPLGDLDCIGFNVSHEMMATSILQILDLGEVPLLRKERGDADPIIIAGGEAVSNPFPLSDFIDLFFLGDGEDAIIEIAKVLCEGKKGEWPREKIIETLANIDGVLNPAGYNFKFKGIEAEGEENAPVKKRVYRGNEPADPVKPLVPSMRITQERAVLEVARGCYNLCKFCHAGYYTLPYRPFDVDSIVEKTFSILENTGYNELTLSSLSISDYKNLTVLLNRMLPKLNEEGVSISLPSLKVDSTTLHIIEMISDVRKSSLTFAVEAASVELRERVNKKVYEEELLKIVEYVFSHGWKVLKLYFMIGLPGSEEIDEAASIVDLLKKIKNISGKNRDVNVTVSPFIPKPHTPFEREIQRDEEYLDSVVFRLKKELPRSIKIKSHDLSLTVLEGIFARGDERLGEVILKAYRQGCRLDSWREYFKAETWFSTLDSELPWWRDYLNSRKEGTLPWESVVTGYEKLKNQWETRCVDLSSFPGAKWRYNDDLDREKILEGLEKFKKRYEATSILRLKLSKLGRSRYLSHLDFLEVIRRALRMADIPVAFSQGFNKRERIATGYPVPLGIESESEIIDIDLYGAVDGETVNNLGGKFPEGIELIESSIVDKNSALMGDISGLCYRIDSDSASLETIEKLCREKPSFSKKTKKGISEVAFDDAVRSCRLQEGDSLYFEMKAAPSGTLRIDIAMQQLAERAGLLPDDFKMVKIGQYLGNDKNRIFI